MTIRVLQGHVLDVLASLPARSVHVCVTSPPYWNLRAYQTEPQVWGGVDGCEHEWGPAIVDHKRGADAGPSARAGNTVARVCPPTTQQGAFCQRCGAWRGELGSEPTLSLFVSNLVTVFEAVKRVLRDDGTLWINLGDSYAGGGMSTPSASSTLMGGKDRGAADYTIARKAPPGLKDGDLCMAPARFALAMQQSGWRLRSEITLCKTAPMPESVQGVRWERCRVRTRPQEPRGSGLGVINARGPDTVGRSGGIAAMEGAEWADCPGCLRCEQTDGLVQRWGSGRPTSATEKLYVFAKGAGPYFYDVDAIRVKHADPERGMGERESPNAHTRGGTMERGPTWVPAERQYHPSGRNLWNYVMWSPEPSSLQHYAAYPRWLPRLAIQAGTSEAGVCPTCGAPWLRVVERRFAQESAGLKAGTKGMAAENGWGEYPRGSTETTTHGWRQSCRCAPHSPVPATVLDPFSGSGTTLIEANALGRHGIGVELLPAYVDITHQRLAGAPLSLFAWEGQEPLSADAAGAVQEVAG